MRFLIAISIGPVQSFIAAARKTRDLWFGSYMLSEIAKAVATRTQNEGAELIFPASETETDLERDSGYTVGNVVLAATRPESSPEDIAKAAREAAEGRWSDFTGIAKNKAGTAIDINRFEEQVSDAIEVYAAWAPLTENYAVVRQRVMRLLTARKALRDFKQAPGKDRGIPKSSLDAARPSVIKDRQALQRRLKLAEGEILDAVGVVKRLAGEASYPSVSRVAADPWIRHVKAHFSDHFNELKEVCESLVDAEVIHRVSYAPYNEFPYEAACLYRSRQKSVAKEADVDPVENFQELNRILNEIKEMGLGEPSPYLGVLVADGDHIGRVLSSMEDMNSHREFSRALSRYAKKARAEIEGNQGVLVYAGGDDLLAFLPLDQCLKCVENLRELFRDSVPSTVSAGLAIGHFMEPLEDLLQYAKDALHYAKSERDALAVCYHARGGVPIRERYGWDVVARMKEWIRHMGSGEMATKVGYELRDLARMYDEWTSDHTGEALHADAIRVLRRKEGRTIELLEPHLKDLRDIHQLKSLANELVIADHLASHIPEVRVSGGGSS